MPPRGRKKVGLKRKDAAIDAMLLMGFPRQLINQTITELLKAYGGNDGWIFIEMDSYKALIEAMLEKNVPEVESSQDDDLGGKNSNILSEAGSSSVPPPPVHEEVSTLAPPHDDDLDSVSQTKTVVKPTFPIPESECNIFTSPAEEREEGAAAPMLPCSYEDPGPTLSFAKCNVEECEVAAPPSPIPVLPCSYEDPGPTLSFAKCAFTSPAEECEVAAPPDPVSNINNSVAPRSNEHPAPVLSSPEGKVFTPQAVESQVPGHPDPIPNPNVSMAPCFDEHPAPDLSPMSDKHRPPCHGWRKRGRYDEPTNLVELEPSPLPPKVLKLLGRDMPRPRKRRWDVKS